MGLITQILKMIKGNPTADYIKDTGNAFNKLNRAKTPREKKDAARAIQDAISKF